MASMDFGLLFCASAASADRKVLKKVPPEFPEAAVSRRINDVVEGLPPPAKVFNAAATAALKQWKFEGNGQPQVAEIKLVFSME